MTNTIKFILLISMLFLHIVDDYYLQGILAKMKQRKWWQENAPQSLYKHDYIIALTEHAFSWAVMVHIPVFVLFWQVENIYIVFILTLVANWILHAIIDHIKANKLKINLITDQLCHVMQIIGIWYVYIEV